MKELIKNIKKFCKKHQEHILDMADQNRKIELESLEFRKNLSIYKRV